MWVYEKKLQYPVKIKKEHKTVQQTAIDKDKKMRNNLLLGALTIALALFFYWCFGNDWVSIGIFTACIVFPVSILLAFMPRISKLTGRSTPFKLSFRPDDGLTNTGAETRSRFSF